MPKLIATCDGHRAIEHQLSGMCRIGSHQGFELCLPGELVSSLHAAVRWEGVVWREGYAWVVRDCASATGTRLNGLPLSPGVPRVLADGDRLTIGEWQLIYCDELASLGRLSDAPASGSQPAAVFAPQHVPFAHQDVGALLRRAAAGVAAALALGRQPVSEAPAEPDAEAEPSPAGYVPKGQPVGDTGGRAVIQIAGSDPVCDLVLNYPGVARRHCRIIRTRQGAEIEDLGSSGGTYLNGARLNERQPLRPGDSVRLGTAPFVFRKDRLEFVDLKRIERLDAIGLVTKVRTPAGPLTLLHGLHFTIEAQQFVAVVGASGSGKSTLLNALTGFRKAGSGSVLINGMDTYANPELFRETIGYVPQGDIVHRELTVSSVLRYAARLRMPPGTKSQEIERAVTEALQELKLTHRKDQPVGTLSGGERKRVNVGVELLTRPNLLFLDEPTSGLDPGLELEFIELVRRLTNEGRTIIMTTHATSSIAACDRLLFLTRGGRIAYFGPPAGALAHFEVAAFADAYVKVNSDAQPPANWERKFRESPLYERYIGVLKPPAPRHPRGGTKRHARAEREPIGGRAAWHQFKVLVRRYAATIRGDLRNTAFLLAQAPIVALLLMAVFPADLFTGDGHLTGGPRFSGPPLLLFCIVISALLFGIVNGCRELTKERAIYRRERLASLQLWPYLLSKVAVLSVLCAVQSVLLVALVGQKVDFGVTTAGLIDMLGVLCLTSWSGMLLGLFISAAATSNDQAVSLVPIVVLPQLIFSGLIDINTLSFVSKLTPSYWAYAALGHLTRLTGKPMFTQSPVPACIALFSLSLIPLWLSHRRLKLRDQQLS